MLKFRRVPSSSQQSLLRGICIGLLFLLLEPLLILPVQVAIMRSCYSPCKWGGCVIYLFPLSGCRPGFGRYIILSGCLLPVCNRSTKCHLPVSTWYASVVQHAPRNCLVKSSTTSRVELHIPLALNWIEGVSPAYTYTCILRVPCICVIGPQNPSNSMTLSTYSTGSPNFM